MKTLKKTTVAVTLSPVRDLKSQIRDEDRPVRKRRSISWTAMLALVALAILLAAAFAYLLVNPFFHQRAPQATFGAVDRTTNCRVSMPMTPDTWEAIVPPEGGHGQPGSSASKTGIPSTIG